MNLQTGAARAGIVERRPEIRAPAPQLAVGRLPLMALAGASLLAALWTGLVRLGWQWSASGLLPAGQHGAFMVSGILGTLISLERAVALRQNQQNSRPGTVQPCYDNRLYYLVPALAGLGSLALLVGLPPLWGRGAISLGALGITLLFLVIYRLQPDAAHATMAAGTLAWLAGDLLWLAFGGGYLAGPIYDAMVHSIFLGFVFSMIFGHAPVIIPAVLHLAIPYRRVYYLHLVLLHISLLVRVAGDLALDPILRRWGGLFNVVAILLFLAVTLAPFPRVSDTTTSTGHRQ